jgi:signal recognition particle subunit SRP54
MLEKISGKFNDIIRRLSGKAVLTEKNIQEAVEEIKLALLEADVSLRVVRRFVNRAIEEAKGEKVLRSVNPGQMFTKLLFDKMVEMLGSRNEDLRLKGPDTLSVILMVGLQGSGKTTTAAKLAARLKKQGRRVLLGAADLVRPAAVKQLEILGAQIGVEVFTLPGGDPVEVARQARKYGEKNSFNVLILDTSGRMHLDDDLMKEAAGVAKAALPDEILLVADAMTGQQAADIAAGFEERLGLTGVILTKFDSDARGGAALSIKGITGKPVKFAGTGEKIEDLELFYPERIASRILGMGDVVSLVEKAQEIMNQEEALELQGKMASSTWTLQDYLDQFRRVRKMGSLKSLMEMMPGLSGKIDEGDINESEMKKEEAIILSMTPAERLNYRILGPSRRKRIAGGSGTNVYEVNRLLKKFEKTRLMMKKVSKNKKYQANLMSALTQGSSR